MNAVAELPQPTTFPGMLRHFQSEIARALPKHLSAERMARIALTEYRKNPKLAECDPRSLFAAVVMASQLGLEPGLLGQCYLIPYKKECQLIPGYQGLLELVRRSGKVRRIEAQVVYERDKFRYQTGLQVILEHEPVLDGERGEPRLAYAVAEFVDGGFHVEVMTRSEIEGIRDRGSNAQNAKRWGKKTPWDTDADQMWRKTILRRLCKFLPKSIELAQALALDSAAETGVQGVTISDAVEGAWSPPPLIENQQEEAAPMESAALTAEVLVLEPCPPPVDPTTDLLTLIREAQTVEELKALNRDITRLRNDDRTRVVAAWKQRRAALEKAG